MPHALLVEDDLAAVRALTTLVERRGFTVAIAGDAFAAKRELDRRRFDVVLLDVYLPGASGIDLLLEMPRGERPDIVLMSGDESVRNAFSVLPLEDMLFLRKPIDPEELDEILRGVRRRRPRDRAPARSDAELIGRSGPLQRVRTLLHKVGPTELPVYVEGESGTGKELVARAIHRGSRRADGPFVAVNCGALPESLIDSELFGHEKGAFTGADQAREGVFEQANGGTLFLDEIAEMPLELQVRLLRTLETGYVRRVGGKQDVPVDVRIVSATNRPFDQALAQGVLREDLFHRLCVFPIVLPPLRDRGEDVELLARHFVKQFGHVELELAPCLLDVLRRYEWPGNVRQLRNALQRAVVLTEGQRVEAENLPDHILQTVGTARPLPRIAAETEAAPMPAHDDSEEIRVEVGTSIAAAERRLIEATIERMEGDKRSAAEVLGVSLRTLYNRLNEYARETQGETG